VMKCVLQMLHGGVSRLYRSESGRSAVSDCCSLREEIWQCWSMLTSCLGQANPPYFGSGTGTRGRSEDKGSGMRSKDEIERERGRYGVDIGRRV